MTRALAVGSLIHFPKNGPLEAQEKVKKLLDSGVVGNFIPSWLASKNNEKTLSYTARAIASDAFKVSISARTKLTVPECSNKNALDMEFSAMGKHALLCGMIIGRSDLMDLRMKLCCEYDIAKWIKIRVLMKSSQNIVNWRTVRNYALCSHRHSLRMSRPKKKGLQAHRRHSRRGMQKS